MPDQEQAATTDTETLEGSEQGKPETTENGADNGATPVTQADIDRQITKAITTARGNWEKEAEQRIKEAEDAARKQQLESEGKWEELVSELKAERDAERVKNEARDYQLNARKKLDELEMGPFADVLIHPGIEDLEQTRERAEKLKSIFDDAVKTAVEQRLDTGKRVLPNTSKPEGKTPDELAQDDPEKYLAWKKSKGLA